MASNERWNLPAKGTVEDPIDLTGKDQSSTLMTEELSTPSIIAPANSFPSPATGQLSQELHTALTEKRAAEGCANPPAKCQKLAYETENELGSSSSDPTHQHPPSTAAVTAPLIPNVLSSPIESISNLNLTDQVTREQHDEEPITPPPEPQGLMGDCSTPSHPSLLLQPHSADKDPENPLSLVRHKGYTYFRAMRRRPSFAEDAKKLKDVCVTESRLHKKCKQETQRAHYNFERKDLEDPALQRIAERVGREKPEMFGYWEDTTAEQHDEMRREYWDASQIADAFQSQLNELPNIRRREFEAAKRAARISKENAPDEARISKIEKALSRFKDRQGDESSDARKQDDHSTG